MFEHLKNPEIIWAYGLPVSPHDAASILEYFKARFEKVYWKEEDRWVVMLLHPEPDAQYTFADFKAMHGTGIWLTELQPSFHIYEERDGAYFKAGALGLKIGDSKESLYESISLMAEANGMVLA